MIGLPNRHLLDRAGAWFLQSGIQAPGGGVSRVYRTDLRNQAPVSNEITGYAVSALLFLHEITGERLFAIRALKAADYLANAWDDNAGAMPFESEASAGTPRLAYFFDCGIIVRGLLRAWLFSGDKRYRNRARDIGLSMAADFCSGGVIHPVVALPEKTPLPHCGGWSRRPGCYQLKSAMAWLDLCGAGDVEFVGRYDAAEELARSNDDCFLGSETDSDREMDRLHAYCYYLEGLLASPRRAELGPVFERGIERIETWLRWLEPTFVRSDVYAQLLRMRLFAEAYGLMPLDRAAAEREAAAIKGFQFESEDPRVSGAFGFGKRDGRPTPYANPVSTAFCLQALTLWEQYESGGFRPSLLELI